MCVFVCVEMQMAESREIFLNSAAEDEESAAMFLRSEMAELPWGMFLLLWSIFILHLPQANLSDTVHMNPL